VVEIYMNPFHRTQRLETIRPQAEKIDQQTLALMRLVTNDQKMYAALQNFLLLAPGRQITQLEDASSLVAKGDAARTRGNNLSACVFYETAAKIEIYNQNKEGARICLIRAQGVSELKHHEFQETMLADMDQVLRVSEAYQGFIPQRKWAVIVSGEPKTAEKAANKKEEQETARDEIKEETHDSEDIVEEEEYEEDWDSDESDWGNFTPVSTERSCLLIAGIFLAVIGIDISKK
jgi:hypothetical protein